MTIDDNSVTIRQPINNMVIFRAEFYPPSIIKQLKSIKLLNVTAGGGTYIHSK